MRGQDIDNNALARVTSRDTWPPKWVATAAVPTVQPKVEVTAIQPATVPNQIVTPAPAIRQPADPAYADPFSDRSRIPLCNRLVPAWSDRILSWEEMSDLFAIVAASEAKVTSDAS
jgi:hypothetical protein